ncbi:hypothetical protein V2J09_010858 [Rumex salicifolius]
MLVIIYIPISFSSQANEILSSFDDRFGRYATIQLIKSGVRLVHGMVKDVQPDKIIHTDGAEVPYCLIDEWLRVPSVPDVFAIGDCIGFLESTGKPVLPALAQV